MTYKKQAKQKNIESIFNFIIGTLRSMVVPATSLLLLVLLLDILGLK